MKMQNLVKSSNFMGVEPDLKVDGVGGRNLPIKLAG
jgi:hypothetical protein